MKIKDLLSVSEAHRNVADVLDGLAAQENCDGEPYDQMAQAAEYIRALEKAVENLSEWVTASLECASWRWDADQYQAAASVVADARELIR